ncbi:hypothetical protein J6590_061557 [Homalodisca vitripennis]|nr:hypothetical protein J6590_061557 [Homalodisca vitripennis]
MSAKRRWQLCQVYGSLQRAITVTVTWALAQSSSTSGGRRSPILSSLTAPVGINESSSTVEFGRSINRKLSNSTSSSRLPCACQLAARSYSDLQKRASSTVSSL